MGWDACGSVREFNHGCTQMHTDEPGTNKVSERVIGGTFRVINALGAGFVEKVNETALAHDLRNDGLAVVQQRGIVVRYDGVVVGEYAVDLLVAGKVMVELKVARALAAGHAVQSSNSLKATGMRVCLLINLVRACLEIRRFKHGI